MKVFLVFVVFFPLYCLLYMIVPNSKSAKFMRKPFMKFLIHASSYLFFLCKYIFGIYVCINLRKRVFISFKIIIVFAVVLILVSQRAEVHAILLFGTESMRQSMEKQLRRQRGNGPSPLELLIVLYVVGFVWEEMQEMLNEGIHSYLRNMWNFIDFSRNSLYCLVASLRYFKLCSIC